MRNVRDLVGQGLEAVAKIMRYRDLAAHFLRTGRAQRILAGGETAG
jgi:hypothetical protein